MTSRMSTLAALASRTRRIRICLMVAVALLLYRTAEGQTLTTVTGVVEDATEAIVPGAVVSLVNQDSGQALETVTDQTGRFKFAVATGDYTLVARVGDLNSGQQAITVGPQGLDVRVRVRVEVGEQVTVTAGRPDPLAPAANATAVAFDENLFRLLPSSGDDILQIVGAFLAPATFGANGTSIIVDGVETDDLDTPSWAVKDVVVNSNPFSAAFQRPGTSRIEVTTKQPSRRRVRGTFSLFDRNSMLDARAPFAVEKPPLDRRSVEGGLSGPLPFDHASFFVNGSHLGEHSAALVNARTPDGALVQNVPADHEHTNIVVRVDTRPAAQNTLTVFYTATNDRQTADGVGGFTLEEHGTAPHQQAQRVRIADQAILSPHLTHMIQASVGWQDRSVGTLATAPTLIVNGAFTDGPAATFRDDRDTTVELNDSATYARGAHTVQFGGRVRPQFVNAFDQSNLAGTFRFASLSAFRTAKPYVFQLNGGGGDLSFDDTRASAYVQDEIRVRQDLSVLIGLRDDWQSLLSDRLNLAPRFSIAFAPREGGTVIRAGGGLFNDHLPDAAQRRALFYGEGGLLQELTVLKPRYPAGLDTTLGALPSLVRLDSHLETPTMVDATLSVEHPIGKISWVSATVEQLRGRHLFRSRDVNAPSPDTGLRPDPGAMTIAQIESSASQDSHALILAFRSGVGRVFMGTAQYRLSKTTNDTSGIFVLPADSYDLGAERGRADFDRRHQLNLFGTLSLPRAFKVGTVVALGSGLPYDITTGNSRDGMANERPAGVTRNTGRGPGLAQVDLRVSRLFRLPTPVRRERTPRNFDLNLDAFNVLNRVNYVNFVGTLTSPFFGRPNSALAPRTLQLSLKYHF